MTTDEVLGDAIAALTPVRAGLEIVEKAAPGVPVLEDVDVVLSLVYETLVHVRQALLNNTEEDIRAALVAKAQRAIQQLVVLKLGALPPPGVP